MGVFNPEDKPVAKTISYQPQPVESKVVVIVNRLTQPVFDNFVLSLGGQSSIIVSGQTTEIQAGFMLGVQHVLTQLRKGIVVTDTSAPV